MSDGVKIGAFGELAGTSVEFDRQGVSRMTYPDGTEFIRDSRWKGIDSAPKDGFEILVVDMRSAIKPMYVVYWLGEWCVGAGDAGTFMVNPTHWQPLPDYPALPK